MARRCLPMLQPAPRRPWPTTTPPAQWRRRSTRFAPTRAIDLDDRSARSDLWQRIRNGFAIRDIDDRYVKQREKYFASQPEYMARMTDRGSRYLFHIVEEVERRGLPTELALLPFIESAFNPKRCRRRALPACGSSCRPPAATST